MPENNQDGIEVKKILEPEPGCDTYLKFHSDKFAEFCINLGKEPSKQSDKGLYYIALSFGKEQFLEAVRQEILYWKQFEN